MGADAQENLQRVRVVLDTNTVISVRVFRRGRLGWIRGLWTAGRVLPLVCRATARELIEALAYPKFKLDESEIRAVLAAYLPFTETVDVPDDTRANVPRCSDPDDQKFLRLAAIGRADVLVSGDRALLEVAGAAPSAIETAAEFKKRLEP